MDFADDQQQAVAVADHHVCDVSELPWPGVVRVASVLPRRIRETNRLKSMTAVFPSQHHALNVPFRGPMATYARTELEFAPLHLSVGNDKAAQPLVTPAATAAPLSEEQQDSGGDGLEEGLLPRLTRVLIRGSGPTPLCSGTRFALHTPTGKLFTVVVPLPQRTVAARPLSP